MTTSASVDLKTALQGVMEALAKMTKERLSYQPPLDRTIAYDEDFTPEKCPTAGNILAGSRTVAIMYAGVATSEQRDADGEGIVALKNFLTTHGAALLGLVEEQTQTWADNKTTALLLARIERIETLLEQRTQALSIAEQALFEETRCEECRGLGSRTTEAGVEECGGCEGGGEYHQHPETAEALLAIERIKARQALGEGAGTERRG